MDGPRISPILGNTKTVSSTWRWIHSGPNQKARKVWFRSPLADLVPSRLDYYPNFQNARTLWYHDHALHWTAENAYFGQAGMYLITDSAEDALGLPSGYGEHDIPLVLTAKEYNSDGTLKTTQGEDTSVWGDVIHVNGEPWPFMNVEPRKYRFRFLNAAVSRNFDVYFVKSTATGTKLPFQVIASDTGLLEGPVQTSDIKIAVAERYEIVFDFSQYAGQTLFLRNDQDAGGSECSHASLGSAC